VIEFNDYNKVECDMNFHLSIKAIKTSERKNITENRF
jgi:hypothetical protein